MNEVIINSSKIHNIQENFTNNAKNTLETDSNNRTIFDNQNQIVGGEETKVQVEDKGLDIKQLKDLVKKIDTNSDKVISTDEIKNCSKDNIEQLKEAIGMGLNLSGLKWSIGKQYVADSTTKDSMKEFFKNPSVMTYFNDEIWGSRSDKENQKKYEKSSKHFKEILEKLKFTEKDLRELNFTEEQIKYFSKK